MASGHQVSTSGPLDWSPRAHMAIYVEAGHDVNGNPRRGWAILHRMTGDLIDFVDEGYKGSASLRRNYPEAVESPRFTVTPGQYRDLRRFEREQEKKHR